MLSCLCVEQPLQSWRKSYMNGSYFVDGGGTGDMIWKVSEKFFIRFEKTILSGFPLADKYSQDL